jgi:hypothetical protein
MTSVFILTFDGVDGDPAQIYDKIIEEMDLGGSVPDGAVWHYAGPYGDGWRVVDLWEDEGAFERFAQEQIGPLSGKHGLTEPHVERIPVDEVRDGDASGPGFLQIVRLPFDGDTFRSMDDKVLPGGSIPADIVHHVNGPGGDGHWVVVDSWTSKEARDRFLEANVFPNFPSDAPPPDVQDLEVHNTLN